MTDPLSAPRHTLSASRAAPRRGGSGRATFSDASRWSGPLALALCAMAGAPAATHATERPNEAALFGDRGDAPDAGGTAAQSGADVRDEAGMFGGTSGAETESAATLPGAGADGPSAGTQDGDGRDDALLSGGSARSRFDTAEETSDPLKVGGTLLLSGQAFVQDGTRFRDVFFSAPSILDVYLDARPNERVRAFAAGRLQYDSTRGAQGSTSPLAALSVGTTAVTGSNPSVALDQLWLRFDVDRKVFLTIGRQKVRWGVGRIWYPTDFLNAAPKDPLNPFDVRLGVNALKVHVPVESLGWNFYGFGLLDSNGPAGTLGRLGGALRAEFVLGSAELGLGGAWVDGRRPRYAVDLSTALGPFDVYGEIAFRSGADFVRFGFPDGIDEAELLRTRVRVERGGGVVPFVTAGASYQLSYGEKYTAFLTAEYFHNPIGYQGPAEGVALLFAPQFLKLSLDPLQSSTLYRPQHSIAMTAAFPGLPGYNWITLSASDVTSLSDGSGLVRLDASFRVLTYLTVQAYGAAFYGGKMGQFSLSLDEELPAGVVGPTPVRVQVRAPRAQAGVLLRLAI